MPLSLRQKIFFSYLILFVLFMALMYPFATAMVKRIMIQSMDDRTTELIRAIRGASNNEELIEYLKDQKPLIFFRVSLISNERKVLYDTHTRRLLSPEFQQDTVVRHPEVLEALKEGKGYHEEYSEILGQDFSYFAKTFPFQGKTYVMRTSFPYKYVSHVVANFEYGFLIFSTGILLLFSLVTWMIINRLTRPIDEIVEAIKPYEEGKATTIPTIDIGKFSSHDEFGRLATTLNSLSSKVQDQIGALTNERNERSAILQSLVEGVIAVDQEFRVTYANKMANALLREGKSLVGESLTRVRFRPYFDLVEVAIREQEVVMGEHHHTTDEGRMFLEMVAVPTKGPAAAILVIQDKTDHYQMLEMKKSFIANASHELKTPITIIRGFAEALRDNPDMKDGMRQDVTDKIVRNTERMTNLIKDLLTLTDVENLPAAELVPCDLVAIADHCCTTLRDLFPEAKLEVKELSEGPFIAMGDPELIELAVTNLMENGAKYSEGVPEITLSLNQVGHQIELSISDQGIGIPKSDLENIFQRFYTVDKAHSRKMGGSGLGLSIVETVISKHGGKIRCESEVGMGTTFIISLPMQMEAIR